MKSRPAEASGLAGALALVIAALLGVDDVTALVIAGAAVGTLPALATVLVTNGGVRGVLRLLWRGRS